ncbi:DUF4192 domain-containing protein [Gordonia sp. VNQ95]|uniref:DUF4192 domain-containing protein n=1 Tax=Gordonia sp. VNQ95 TaxID=3156619 RepID=UPI0032B4E8BA
MTFTHPRRLKARSLLSAVPALLGFIPESSVILVVLRPPNHVGVAMRYDLSLTESGAPDDDLLDVLDRLGTIIERQGGGGPVVGVIADRRFHPDDRRYRQVMAVANRFLAAVGGIAQGFVVTDFEEHAPWHLIWDPRGDGPTGATLRTASATGTLTDPRTSPTAIASAVETGRRILARRSDMAAMLTPLPHCTSASCFRSESPATAPMAVVPPGVADPDECAALLTDLLTAMAEPPDLGCAGVARLERAILTLDVRDAALACAVTDLRAGAEYLWRELARRLIGTGRASAATLLAHLHYVAGEGGYAGVALDCALTADPDWALARLLDRALRGGLEPAVLRETIDDSYAQAAEWGMDLPRMTLRQVG